MRLIDIIKENISLAWDSDMISANPDITIQDMLDNPHIKWNYYSANYKATISDLLKPIPKGPNRKPLWRWEYSMLSYRIHVDDILAHKDLGWKWNNVCGNNTLTFNHVLTHNDIPWDWSVLYIQCPFSIEMYHMDPYKPWNFNRLSWNRGLHIDDVLANLDLKWDWAGISANATITIDHILKHHSLPWRWDRLSLNIPLCDIFRYQGLPWTWNLVAYNQTITFDDFIHNSHEKIVLTSSQKFFCDLNIDNIKYIYENHLLDNLPDLRKLSTFFNIKEVEKAISWYSNISMKDVLDNQEIPWNKLYLVTNKHISPKDMIEHRDFFDNECMKRIFNHPKLEVDDILALKDILSENDFKSQMEQFQFHSDNITISDIVREKHLPWNWDNMPQNLKVERVL
jgi:hypothetical protein